MKEFIKSRYIDILVVVLVSIFVYWEFYNSNRISRGQYQAVIWLILLIPAITHSENFRRFVKTLWWVVLAVGAIFCLILLPGGGSEGGYILLFWIGSSIQIIVAALGAFVVAKVCHFIVGERIAPLAKKTIIVLFFIFMSTGVAMDISVSSKNYNEDSTVTTSKYNFIKRIMTLVGESKLSQYTNKELIDAGTTSGVYETSGDQIYYGYGGTFRIEKVGQNVDLIFEGVPSGDKCFHMYFIDNPEIDGFDTTKVDGIVVNSSAQSMPSDDPHKNGPCYSGKEKVTVEFIGSTENITESYKDWEEYRQRSLEREGPGSLVGSIADPWK